MKLLRTPNEKVFPVRRKHDRVAISIPVLIRRGTAEAVKGSAEDISEGGARIRLERPLPAEGAIEIEFRLAGMRTVLGGIVEVDEVDSQAPMRTKETAQVRWAGQLSIGVQFSDTHRETVRFVKKLMNYLDGMRKGRG